MELMPWSIMLLCCFLQTREGEVTGISFIDSTPIEVCFVVLVVATLTGSLKDWSDGAKTLWLGMQQAKLASVTQWRDLGAYALRFKLHLIINNKGELLVFKLTTCGQALCGNVDDRKPVPDMTTDIIGKLFGDRGYISQTLFEQLYEQGLKLITRRKKNMKQQPVKLMDKILLRKRSLIEAVNDQLKNTAVCRYNKHNNLYEVVNPNFSFNEALFK